MNFRKFNFNKYIKINKASSVKKTYMNNLQIHFNFILHN